MSVHASIGSVVAVEETIDGGAEDGFVQFGGVAYILYAVFSARAPVKCKSRITGAAFAAKYPEAGAVYARLDKDSGEWGLSDGKSKKLDKIFLKKAYAEGVPEFVRGVGGARAAIAPIVDDSGVESAPDIVELELDQRFKDEHGEVVYIETRGERTVDGIFFKMEDVMKVFGLPSLNRNIHNDTSTYEAKKDYVYFNCKLLRNKDKLSIRIKKDLFLTYRGILRVLFTSRTGNAHNFVKWATETLFVAQMGSREQKTALSAKLLGATPEAVRAVFDGYDGGFQCIYLMDLGPVSKLREAPAFKIPTETPDDSHVYKYGFTKDISRRIKEHSTDYGELTNNPIRMTSFYVVDPKFMVEAESELRKFFRAFSKELPTEGRRELIVLSASELDVVKTTYKRVGREFSGNTQGMQDIINGLTTEINLMCARLERELAAKDYAHEAAIKEMETKTTILQMQLDMGASANAAILRCSELEIENRDLKISALTIELAHVRAQ
jgi:hypothetical protein